MQEDLARQTIHKTFSYPFKEENFINLSVNILDHLIIKELINHSYNKMSDYLKENIESFKLIGEYEYNNYEKINVLIINLKNRKTVDKARSVQKKFAEWYMHINNCDGLLIAFNYKEYENWRFSTEK